MTVSSVVAKLARIPEDLLQMVASSWPGPLGHRLRRMYWGRRLRYLGRDSIIDVGVHFQNPEFVTIDDNTWIDRGVVILAGEDTSERQREYIDNPDFPGKRGTVHIGRSVHIAPGCVISGIAGVHISDDCTLSAGVKMYSFSHHPWSPTDPADRSVQFGSMAPADQQFMREGPIFVGANVGMGIDAIVLPGVVVGTDSFVAAQSLLTGSFEENSLIAGSPARRVRARYADPEE